MNNILIIKHLPSELCDDDKVDLCQQFGAIGVNCLNFGKMKGSVFANFDNANQAKKALLELHQKELLGKRLCVEYAHSCFSGNFPTLTPDLPEVSKNIEDVSQQNVAISLNNISDNLGIHRTFDPDIKYSYPDANLAIISHISNALLTIPEFYTQVLHLMNKMNLPCPFEMDTTHLPYLFQPAVSEFTDIREETMSSDESELQDEVTDSDGIVPLLSTLPFKRKLIPPTKPSVSKLKQQEQLRSSNKESNLTLEHVFESPNLEPPKKKLTLFKVSEDEGLSEKFVPIDAGCKVTDSEIVIDNDAASASESEEVFITKEALETGRAGHEELLGLAAFKNYNPGQPSPKLYIKNIHKKTTEKDLRYIFGRYVDFRGKGSEFFEIKLMKSGKMKGQAFITLPNVKAATKALEEINGFVQDGKPLAVFFAKMT